MGGLLHLFDFHNNTFSKKSHLNQKIHEDLEAPRNSFELLQVDNFHTYKDKTKSYEIEEEEEEEWYERGCYPIEESMRKTIINELSKQSNDNTKQTTPSLVAKLMGMDSLPLHSPKSTNWVNPPRKSNQFHEELKNSDKISRRKGRKEKLPSSSSSSMESEIKPPLQIRREHPQEEELQRFRREFEAWQSNKTFKDCSKIIESEKNLFTRTRSFGRDFDKISNPTPTRIVVLRPGHQRVYDFEDSLTTSSATTMEGSKGSIEEFLEEVKERLKEELQGKSLIRSSSVRGSGIETPYSERPSPKSEFIRSYATSEVQCNAPDSPEFISKDTRRLLSEKLRNVLRKEISPQEDLMTRTSSRLRSSISSDVENLRKLTDDQLNRSGLKKESSLPSRNLKRSLSAPVSGTSFGKLLLEDRHVLTGAKIIRKHEMAITEQEEEVGVVIDPIRRKERFNLRKKVSSFRSSLRGRIFGKKIRSMIESNSFEDESIKDFVTGSRINSFYDRNENSTEVPPSPASVCSSTPDEYWRNVDYLTPISTPDVTISDENGMPQVFRDISSNLSELRRQINELETDVRTPIEQQEANQEIELLDLVNPDKVFVRDLLVASGLYDGTLDRTISRWDPLAKPINKSVLQQTKEKRINQDDDDDNEENEEEKDHKILFDLLNEAVAMVLGPLNQKNLVNLKGKNLLESTWKIMSEYLYVQTTEKPFCSLDGIISWDLEKFPWSCLISEEVNVMGKEIEGLIMVDLVEEVVKDLRT